MQKTVTIDVCDTCEDPKKPVEAYELKGPKNKQKVVLCSVHARPLEVLLGNAKRAGRPPSRASRTTSVEAIEAGKDKS